MNTRSEQKILNILLIGIFTFILTISASLAQAPNKMSYQAVVRNASNALIANQQVGMRISIIQGSIFGASVYVETQTVSTNANGLASLEIGSGNPIFGSFSNISWENGPYYIKTEIDPSGGINYSIIGTTQLLSVPYALYAQKTSLDSGPGISINGNKISNSGDLSNTNEIQQLQIEGDSLSISGGNKVAFPKNAQSYWIEEDSSLYYKNKPVNIGFKNSDIEINGNLISRVKTQSPLNIYPDSQNKLMSFYSPDKFSGPLDTVLTLHHWHSGISLVNNRNNAYIFLGPGRITSSRGAGSYFWEINNDGINFANSRIEPIFDCGITASYGILPVHIYGPDGVKLGGNKWSSAGSYVRVFGNGDVYLNTPAASVILTSPNGKCWKQSVDNNGVLKSILVPCPY
jgi:hypothetical protein